MNLVRLMRHEEEPLVRKGLRWLCEYLLAQELRRPLLMYEIGTFAGESAEIFARYFDEVHCVDPFAGNLTGDAARFSWAEIEASFDERARTGGNIFKHKGLSMEVAGKVSTHSLDFVYIDGDHSYEAVNLDIAVWYSKVKPNGWIGGHDFSYLTPGVPKAVRKHFPGYEIQTSGLFRSSSLRAIKIFPDASWLVKKQAEDTLPMEGY